MRDFLKIFMQLFKFILWTYITIFKSIITLLKRFKKFIIKKLRFSITFKITATYASIFTLMLFILSLSLLSAFTVYVVKNSEDTAYKTFNILSTSFKNSSQLQENMVKQLSSMNNMYITFFNIDGKSLYTTENANNSITFYNSDVPQTYKLNDNYLLYLPSSQLTTNLSDSVTENFNFINMYLILNEKTTWDSKDVYIQIRHNLSREVFSLLILFFILFIINLIFITAISIMGAKTSKRLLRPIETMTNTVKTITVNALNTRLDISGSQDELKDLAETFNNMLDRIQSSYEAQNQFVSDASHELRTPIAVIQGYSNLLSRWGKEDKAVLEESIESIKTEAENMKTLVEKLLFLSRSDKKTQKIEMEDFYINELIDEVTKETNLIDKSHHIENTLNDKLLVNADSKLIKEALRIFIDNSIKYTPEGGKISIDSFKEKNELVISIEDTGIGISKEDLPNIFNRFYRADKSRTKKTGGTGLGLSIAKWIILAHKGTINVKSEINVGTKITLYLPIIKL